MDFNSGDEDDEEEEDDLDGAGDMVPLSAHYFDEQRNWSDEDETVQEEEEERNHSADSGVEHATKYAKLERKRRRMVSLQRAQKEKEDEKDFLPPPSQFAGGDEHGNDNDGEDVVSANAENNDPGSAIDASTRLNTCWSILNLPKTYSALQRHCILALLLWDLVICFSNIVARSLQLTDDTLYGRKFVLFFISVVESGVLVSGVWNVFIIVCIFLNSLRVLQSFSSFGEGLSNARPAMAKSQSKTVWVMFCVFHSVSLSLFVFVMTLNNIMRIAIPYPGQYIGFMATYLVFAFLHTVFVFFAMVLLISCFMLMRRMNILVRQVSTKRRYHGQILPILRLTLYGIPFLATTLFLIMLRELSFINDLILVLQYGLDNAQEHYSYSPLFSTTQIVRGLYHVILPTKPFIDSLVFIASSSWFVALVRKQIFFRFLSQEEQEHIFAKYREDQRDHHTRQPLMKR